MTAKRMTETQILGLLMKEAGIGGRRWGWVVSLWLCICMAIIATAREGEMATSSSFLCVYWGAVCAFTFLPLADNRVLLTLPLSRRERARIKWIGVMLPPVLMAAAMYAATCLKALVVGDALEAFRHTTNLCLQTTALTSACPCISRFLHIEKAVMENRKVVPHGPGAVFFLASLCVIAGVLFWAHLPSALRCLTVGLGLCCLVLPDTVGPRMERLSILRWQIPTRRKKAAHGIPPRHGTLRHFYMLPAFVGGGAALVFVAVAACFATKSPERLRFYLIPALLLLGLRAVQGQHGVRVCRALPFSSAGLTARYAAMYGALYGSCAIVLLAVESLAPALDTGDVLRLLPIAFGAALLLNAALIGLPLAVAKSALAPMIIIPVFTDMFYHYADSYPSLDLTWFTSFLEDYIPSLEPTWLASALTGTAFALLGSLGIYLAITRSSRPYRKPVVME